MQSDPPVRNGPASDKGLPPVSPPTGKLMVQLFSVPFLIVIVIVGFLVVLRWLFGGPGTPAEFLKALDDANAEVRWRAASNLAQTLPRDERMASDADFALQLADRLQKAIAASEPVEKAFNDKLKNLSEKEAEAERRKLEPDRAFVQFLTASLGHFIVPAGVPVLKEVATKEGIAEPKVSAALRRVAVEALAKVGGNLSRFDQLSAEKQDAILEQLQRASENPSVGGWARETLTFLEERRAGHPHTFGVDVAMEKCGDALDPGLRESVAFALNFWQGDAKENERIDQTLVRLLNDTGKGEELRAQLYDDKQYYKEKNRAETVEVLKRHGLLVCYNANLALARRGSSRVNASLLLDMLDEDGLRNSIQLERADGERQPNEAKVTMVLLNTLKAVAELHRKRPDLVTGEMRQAVAKLADNPNKAISTEAKQTQMVLNPGE